MMFKVSDSKKTVMYDVLHIPKLACNLFSVKAAAIDNHDSGYLGMAVELYVQTHFGHNHILIQKN